MRTEFAVLFPMSIKGSLPSCSHSRFDVEKTGKATEILCDIILASHSALRGVVDLGKDAGLKREISQEGSVNASFNSKFYLSAKTRTFLHQLMPFSSCDPFPATLFHPCSSASGRSSGVEHNLAKVRVGRSNRLARSSWTGLARGRSSGVEHNLAKVRVGRSNRLARSKTGRCERVISSVGRALRLHRRCREFESLITHHIPHRSRTNGTVARPLSVLSRVKRYFQTLQDSS